MVALYAGEAGVTSRPTDDVDVLVNVRLAANGTEWLRRHEYFADRANPTWDAFYAQDREQAALVFRRLIA